MIINIILWLLSVISVTYIEIATKLYVHIWTIALALILVPIFYILIFFLYLLLLLIWSFFINKKEEINKLKFPWTG